jgi:hypothetical protein
LYFAYAVLAHMALLLPALRESGLHTTRSLVQPQ